MLAAFDLILIGIAFIIMIVGLSRRWSAWRMGQKEERTGDFSGLLRFLLGHKRILKSPWRGSAHLIMFWGFILPIIIIILAQFNFTLTPILSQILSLFMDIIGAAFLAGTLFFIVRRITSSDPRGPAKVLFPLIILLIILLTGFTAEGVRLSIMHPAFTWTAPLGWLLSGVLPASPVLMQTMIRIHFFAVLLFITLLPFTFIRHLAAAPLNVFYRRKNARGELRGYSLDDGPVGTGTIRDFTWKQLLDAEACVSCGRCEENCPAFISNKPLSPRKVVQDILAQMTALPQKKEDTRYPLIPPLEKRVTADEIWSCSTCMACVEHCPVFIEPLDKIIDMRRYRVMGKGQLPIEARSMIRNIELFGDVQGKGLAYREDWALNRDVLLFYSDASTPDILLWVGCFGGFHPRYQEVTRSMVAILKAAGVRFGILGKGERCCGDPARRLGDESLFLEIAQKNIQCLRDYGVRKIVTLCPHCFNTLKNEYPRIERDRKFDESETIEVVHASEYVMNLIKERRISPKYPMNQRITIHDPCYLGRVNGIYEPPREMVRAVPQSRFTELSRNHEKGFCCGGGGGGMWLHEHLGRRMNAIRAEEIAQTNVEIVGTACPYCLTMLDDGLKALEMEKPPKVLDVVEIVASSIGY